MRLTDIPAILPWLCVLAALAAGAAAAVFATRLRRARQALQDAGRERDSARSLAAATERMLRLAANDFRTPALALLGHADEIGAGVIDPARHGAAVAAVAEQLLSTADALAEHALPAARPCVLRRESLCLGQSVADAVAAVEAALGPGRRHWRAAADLDGRRIEADRRALHQILLRVLTSAARLSRNEDTIDIFCVAAPAGITLMVADEGIGLAALDTAWSDSRPDSRGMGFGLSLARMLMIAHGGSLSIETSASVGTRVALHFPAQGAMAEALLAA
ncbi:MAG: sensor histidine kinase [Proteobacteria bacterium]|nr:sensor histidine kinase [Pseudomonadota bacterium]